jgi:hypothetical protein
MCRRSTQSTKASSRSYKQHKRYNSNKCFNVLTTDVQAFNTVYESQQQVLQAQAKSKAAATAGAEGAAGGRLLCICAAWRQC